MPREPWLLLCSTLALGQVSPRDPFDRAMQSVQEARAHGNPAEAAARRDEARGLLEQMAANSPQWAGRVQNLAQQYQGSGWHAQARVAVQDALSRVNVLPEWHPARIQLLSTLADFWQQDGNLLKALWYWEKAASALEATPSGAASDAARPLPGGVASGSFVIFRGQNNSYLYEQLTELYRQLGRPEATATAVAKMRSLIKNNPAALANSYEQEGDFDQALSLYQKQAADSAAKPQAQIWELIAPLQSIASLYEREGRPAEAVATIEQAVARLDASSEPEAHNQAVGMRLNLANMLQRSGRQQAAEQVYQALLSQSANYGADQQVQVVQQYANHLSETDRGGQGAQMLKDYLANHSALQPWQEGNILSSLAYIVRKAGQEDLADEYQQAAEEEHRAVQRPLPLMHQLIGPELQKAQAAVNQGNLDEALDLALHAIGTAELAPDGWQVAWQVPNVAAQLASKKAPEKGDQVYRALFPMLEAWAVDNVQPLNQALQQYVRFLVAQKDRLGEAALAIDRYRDSLVAAQGAETGGLVQVQQLRIELAQAKDAPEEAVQRAEELLAIEESLSGVTSAPYLRAVQTAASVYQSSGKTDRALVLYRQMVGIADRTLRTEDGQRGFVRLDAAMALASAGQFDEAERLAQEALAVGQALRPPGTDPFQYQAEQIRRLKADAELAPARPAGAVIVNLAGQIVARGGWFVRTTPAPEALRQ